MKLYFSYEMTLTFDSPIKEHYFSLHIEPINIASQRLYAYECNILPCNYYCRELDWCGNAKYTGSSLNEHDYFGFVVSGTIFTSDALVKASDSVLIYKYPSLYTDMDLSMVNFLNHIIVDSFKPNMTNLEKADIIMDRLHQYLTYQSMSTSINTKASESFNLKVGVCQDYSHIFISLLRWIHIPSRYVSGLMYENGKVCYGATHAWVEVYQDGFWFGYDPTNDCKVNQGYIALAKGRDYQDCSIDRGIFKGNTTQYQYINISIKEV